MSALIDPAGWLGNVKAGRTLRFAFFSNAAGVGTALAGTPSLAIYKDASDTQDTDGITLNVSADSVVGLNRVLIDLSADGTFYSAGSDFIVVIAAGTVGGSSVVGTVVATFSIENRTIAGQAGTLFGSLTLDAQGTFLSALQLIGSDETSVVNIEGTDVTNGEPVVQIRGASGGNQAALSLAGSGTAPGLSIIGGPTGAGVTIAGGATSGNGVSVTTTDGHALHLDATGSNKNDLNLGTPATNILDGVSVTAPTGVATTFREMVVQTWRRFFKKATRSSTEIKTYADNGSTVLTTQTISVTGTDEDQGVSS